MWGGIEIPIISLEKFCILYNLTNIVVVASVGMAIFPDIYLQLQGDDRLDNVLLCSTKLMDEKAHYEGENRRAYPESYHITDKQLIPKKIHYCWFGNNPLPDTFSKYIDSWKKFCPDYEIIRWDESNYDIEKNEFTKGAYETGNWGFVPDYARLDIIYHEGGIYLDTDVELIKNLDDLLYENGFMGTEDSIHVSPGLGFGAQKKSEFIKKLMNTYEHIDFDSKNLVPSPTFLKSFFTKEGFVPDNGYQHLHGMTILPELVLSPKSQITGLVHKNDHTFAIHHFDATWEKSGIKEKRNKVWELMQYFSEKSWL
jgi:hypothetical protein